MIINAQYAKLEKCGTNAKGNLPPLEILAIYKRIQYAYDYWLKRDLFVILFKYECIIKLNSYITM